MTANASMTALLRGITGVQVLKTGAGTVTGLGISCGTDCSEAIYLNTLVTLTPTPAVGNSFAGWTGDVCDGQPAGPCKFTAAGLNQSVTATFQLEAAAGAERAGQRLGGQRAGRDRLRRRRPYGLQRRPRLRHLRGPDADGQPGQRVLDVDRLHERERSGVHGADDGQSHAHAQFVAAHTLDGRLRQRSGKITTATAPGHVREQLLRPRSSRPPPA
jgi:hypothetical protein